MSRNDRDIKHALEDLEEAMKVLKAGNLDKIEHDYTVGRVDLAFDTLFAGFEGSLAGCERVI